MKKTPWLTGILAAVLLALVGPACKKEAPPPPPEHEGVVIDLPKLQQTFATAGADIQSSMAKVNFGVRYGKYMDALEGLDKMASDPSTTEPQKKVIAELIEQVKKAINNQAAQPPPPAQ
jgi:hypothetical protein